MKTHKQTSQLVLLVTLLLLLPTNGYTSRRKKSPPSPHYTHHTDGQDHRRLTDKPDSTTGASETITHTANEAHWVNNVADAKANMAPTIQQLKGTIVKDDMNRGPPLASE